MVGDRPSTDGRFATERGLPFGLVLSGVTSSEAAADLDPRPAYVAPDLAALVDQAYGR
jgi:ribonucleotide monophosphatase NagD (HAD superfamily)